MPLEAGDGFLEDACGRFSPETPAESGAEAAPDTHRQRRRLYDSSRSCAGSDRTADLMTEIFDLGQPEVVAGHRDWTDGVMLGCLFTSLHRRNESARPPPTGPV